MTVRWIMGQTGNHVYYNDERTTEEQVREQENTNGIGEITNGEAIRRAGQAAALQRARRHIANGLRRGVRVAQTENPTLRGVTTATVDMAGEITAAEWEANRPTLDFRPRAVRVRAEQSRADAQPATEDHNSGGPQYNCLKFTNTLED